MHADTLLPEGFAGRVARTLQAKGIGRERFLLPEVGDWFTVPPR